MIIIATVSALTKSLKRLSSEKLVTSMLIAEKVSLRREEVENIDCVI